MMKQNKKAFIARDWVVAVILFSGIIVLASLAVGSLSSDYNNPNVMDESFNDNFERFDEEVENAGSMFSSASGREGLTLTGTFDVLFSSSFTVISLFFGGISSVGSQVSGFGEYFGVPASVTRAFFGILLAALSVIAVFIVISSVSRRDL